MNQDLLKKFEDPRREIREFGPLFKKAAEEDPHSPLAGVMRAYYPRFDIKGLSRAIPEFPEFTLLSAILPKPWEFYFRIKLSRTEGKPIPGTAPSKKVRSYARSEKRSRKRKSNKRPTKLELNIVFLNPDDENYSRDKKRLIDSGDYFDLKREKVTG